eukprot:CAMPEP_0185832598 /NCGR_PEP_ID=MMETSP1353-20130828/2176_1 /TAXON_ID=1077150 /ORGANISM="Erythrolobus australicus, Strain CCMP3124" /LENGTH=186 /DNA_ID=CAMNT_0028530787 /DNA_START=127 /DNA_END=684 /DNA_ORIENTATION=+
MQRRDLLDFALMDPARRFPIPLASPRKTRLAAHAQAAPRLIVALRSPSIPRTLATLSATTALVCRRHIRVLIHAHMARPSLLPTASHLVQPSFGGQSTFSLRLPLIFHVQPVLLQPPLLSARRLITPSPNLIPVHPRLHNSLSSPVPHTPPQLIHFSHSNLAPRSQRIRVSLVFSTTFTTAPPLSP